MLAACCAGAVVPAQSQPAGAGAPPLAVQSSLTVQETVTNNRDLTSERHADAVTQIYPAIHLVGRSARVQGSLDYTPVAVVYARESSRNEIQNSLGSGLSAVLFEDHAFIDARAAIQQQAISAFGTQFSGTTLNSDNRSEVKTLSVAPRVRTVIAGSIEAFARGNWSSSRASASGNGDVDSLGATAGLSGGSGKLGWAVDASHQSTDYAASRRTVDDQASLRATYTVDSDLRLGVNGGREWTDALTGRRDANSRWGVSADWQPSERTRLALQADHRYFGQSHSFSFQTRQARAVLSYTDSKDVSASPAVTAQSGPLTLTQLYAQLEPDPVKREQLIRSQGLDPNTLVTLGFLLSTLSVQHVQNLSLAYNAARDTFSLTAYNNDTRRLDKVGGGNDDLNRADRVRQRGVTFGWSHRLTPTAAVGASASLQKTLDASGQQGNEQRFFNLTLSDQIGARTTATFGLRHVQFESPTNPYNESAVYGSVGIRF